MSESLDALPSFLGAYELQERVGAGGMGIVYRAKDRRTGMTVAVKVIHRHLQGEPGFVDRFRNEAHFAALMNSPYIVRVIEFDSDDGQYFLATEFVEGTKLSDLIAQQRIDVEQALTIASQVALALQAASFRGVIHRDIKADNIMIRPDGAVKLTDFGVARLRSVETRQMFIGTVAYAAPEQFRGIATTQSDLYSLGVVLFQMLAGELPFRGPTLTAVMRMHELTPPPLDKLRVQEPRLVALVRKCLEKEPSNRFDDPSSLLAAIEVVRRARADSTDGSAKPATAAEGITVALGEYPWPARTNVAASASLSSDTQGASLPSENAGHDSDDVSASPPAISRLPADADAGSGYSAARAAAFPLRFIGGAAAAIAIFIIIMALAASIEPSNSGKPAVAPTTRIGTAATVPTPLPKTAPEFFIVSLRAEGDAFDTRVIRANAYYSVRLQFTNADAGIIHNVAIYANSQGRTTIFSGSILTGPAVANYDFMAPAPGTYFFRCDVHPDTMTGSFITF